MAKNKNNNFKSSSKNSSKNNKNQSKDSVKNSHANNSHAQVPDDSPGRSGPGGE